MKMFIKVYQEKDSETYYVDRLENLDAIIESQMEALSENENEEGIFIQPVMMTEEEFNTLPEFQGF